MKDTNMYDLNSKQNRQTDGSAIRTVKAIFDFVIITLMTVSVFVAVITARDQDSRWGEIIPIIIGALLFPISLYVFQGIQTVVDTIKSSLVLRRRHIDALSHIDSSVCRSDDDVKYGFRRCVSSILKTVETIKMRYSNAKLSLTFMMQNSCLTLIFLDSLKLVLWFITLTYWRRNDDTMVWKIDLTPPTIYKLHYASLSLTNAELCLFLLATTEITDVLGSFEFWINIFLLPPLMCLIKVIVCNHLTYFHLYWMMGFLLWIKHFLILDKTIHMIRGGIVHGAHRTYKIVLGIFIMTNAFASVMYVLQGIHPNSGVDSAFKHAFKQYGEFFYYSLITFSTVGYGDITPLTIEAKLVALCFIIFMLVWIPYEMNNFIQGVDREKEISGHLYFWGSMQSSIVLIGEVDPIQLSLFIAKIYYSGLKLKIIVISTLSMSSYEIQINQAKILRVSLCIVLDDPGINGNVDILHTIKAKDAVGTFVLSSFKHGDPRKADMKTVGRVISLKKFGISADRVIIQYCSTLRPQIAHRPYTNVVNLYRFKSAIIAKNITCPGIITLIINLSLTHSAIVQRCKGDDLYDNYVRGIGRRLRTIAISERLVGTDFDTLCSNLYNIHGYIVIGIIHGNHNYRTYQLNPSGSGYMIRPGDRAVLVADVESSSKTKHDIVTSGRNSTVPIRSSMISLVLNRIGSDITASLDEMDNDGNLYPMLNQPSLDNGVDNKVHEDALVLQVSPTENNSIIVDSICQACRTVFQDPCRPVMVIVGYSEFVIQLLLYFQELDEFNVVIFGKEVSVKVNPLPLQRFKAFLALIDGDPMSDVDVKRAELFMACYIYVIPSPELDAPGDSEADLDVRTIVTYRHLKSLIQASIKKRGKSKTGTSIYGLVELKCGTNVSYLDDTMWSAWNVLDKKLDPSLSYIHSVEFSRGQFISDEMLYSVTMNTMFIHEDYALYRILFDLVSVSAIDGDTRGIELLPVEDIITQCSKPTFGQLFNYMHTKMHIIPIGIYRIGNEPMENGVMCAPAAEFLVHATDMVYVISKNNTRTM